jgi:hypothetical protein
MRIEKTNAIMKAAKLSDNIDGEMNARLRGTMTYRWVGGVAIALVAVGLGAWYATTRRSF